MSDISEQFILWFDQIKKDDIPLVGGKNANLGEMYQNLTHSSNPKFPGETIQVPFGFAVTAYAYRYFIEKNDLQHKIKETLDGLDTKDMKQLEEKGNTIRMMIISAAFPQELDAAIRSAYQGLAVIFKKIPTHLMSQFVHPQQRKTCQTHHLQDSKNHILIFVVNTIY